MASGETGDRLATIIRNAIDDGKLTNAEYDRILAIADEDGVIDSKERVLLSQLQELLSNGSVKKVPD